MGNFYSGGSKLTWGPPRLNSYNQNADQDRLVFLCFFKEGNNMLENRRPLKTRETKIAKKIAKWLSQKNITPNQISVISIVFSALAAFFLLNKTLSHEVRFLLVAIFIQCRLLCNLLDGMVAIEGGKKSASGELFNDIPDRVADIFVLLAAGYSISYLSWGTTLGWLATLLAVLTAYVRTLATSTGAPCQFLGPMAKQHRMALMTATSLLIIFNTTYQGEIMFGTLLLICIGSTITLYRRVKAAYIFLERTDV
jgi:phosphatidylglycerophosphate synthase